MLNGFGDPAEIERLQSEIAAAGGARVAYSGADLTRPSEIEGMMAQAAEQLGGVDILVNNAGTQHVARWISSRPKSGTC
jgi:3-hydroxybutyrate dehydrogenase